VSDYDPTDLEQQEADTDLRNLSSQIASELADKDFVWLMSGEKGRRIVRRLLDEAGIFQTSFCANALQMANTEGAKMTGFWILQQIERLCPTSYHTMMQETSNARGSRSNNNT